MSEQTVVDRPLPDIGLLVSRLTTALSEPAPVQILERKAEQSGTFPKETVRCRLHDGREVNLFCKYSAPRFEAFGHRRGVPYEAEVYRRVLASLPVTVPSFAGSYHDERTGEAWLVLHNLEGGIRSQLQWPPRLVDVASWLGRFHRLNEGAESNPDLAFLIRYDASYYEGWATRTEQFSAHLHEDRPWIPALCRQVPELVSTMTRSPQTVVHGEYTVNNVMLLGDEVYPTDWESTAIGFGEIDIVFLLDKWPDDIVAHCTKSYVGARWPDGAPDDVVRRLLVADLYMQLRWLAEEPSWLKSGAAEHRLDRLGAIARALGIEGTG